MRRLIVLVVVTAGLATGCSAVSENVSIDIDVEGIVASTCRQLAATVADQVADAVVQLDASADADFPDLDIRAVIDRADDLGCSPTEMESLIRERLAQIDAESTEARRWIEDLTNEARNATQ